MRQRLAQLINIKSIVTLALTMVFCFLAVVGTVDASQFLTIFTTVVGFYFGTQVEKKNYQNNKE